MTTQSILLLLAFIYALLGLAFIVKPVAYEKVFDQLLNHRGLTFILGIVSIVIGYVLVFTHGSFTTASNGFITILGLIAFLKGVFYILLPAAMPKFSQKMIGHINMQQVGMLLIVFAAVSVFFSLV